MVIFIEGADGVGKTTIGMKLAQALNCEFIDRPVHYLIEDRLGNVGFELANSIIPAYYSSENSNFQIAWFNATGLIYLKEKFKDKNVIINRGLLTSIMWNGAGAEDLFESLYNRQIGVGINILLDASDEVRLERMLKRNLDENEVKTKKVKHFDIAPAVSFADSHNMPFLVLDTNNKTPDELLKDIMDYLSINL